MQCDFFFSSRTSHRLWRFPSKFDFVVVAVVFFTSICRRRIAVTILYLQHFRNASPLPGHRKNAMISIRIRFSNVLRRAFLNCRSKNKKNVL